MTFISLKSTIEETRKELNAFQQKQIPFATRLTTNALGQTTKKDIDRQIIAKIDRPTTYSKRMMRVKSSKNRKNPVARVMVKDAATTTKHGSRGPDQILGHLFEGGTRSGKGMEGLMASRGILPRGMYVVPGEAAPLDRFGNIEKGLIVRLLSFFSAFNESGFRANATRKGRAKIGRAFARKQKGSSGASFFVVKDKKQGKLHPGIWARVKFSSGTAVKPILMFVRRPTHKQIISIQRTAEKVVNRDISKEFNIAIRRALATAR